MFQNYLCVISDNIRVNDNIISAWFPKYVVIDSIIIRNQTNVGCNGSAFVSVLLALTVSDCRPVCLCVTTYYMLTVSPEIVLGNIFGHDFPKCIIMVRNQTNEGRDGSAIGFGDFRT